MKNIKLISLSILRFFKINITSLIGFMLLVFFSITIFSSLNSISVSLTSSYTNLKNSGKLHDFVINENYTIGNSNFDVNVVETASNNGEYNYSFTINEELWSNAHAKTFSEFELWAESSNSNDNSFNNFFLNNEKLFFYFSNEDELNFQKTISSTSLEAQLIGLPPTITVGNDGDKEINAINQAKGYLNNFFTIPLNNLVSSIIPIIYEEYLLEQAKDEIEIRRFKALDISVNKQNIYYKIIESSPDFSINKLVLFEGNNLSPNSNFAESIFFLTSEYKANGNSSLDFLVPNSQIDPNNERPQNLNDKILNYLWSYIDLYLRASWADYIFSPIELDSMKNIIKETKIYHFLNPWNFSDENLENYLGSYYTPDNFSNFKQMFGEIKNFLIAEKGYSLLPTNFKVTFSKTAGLTPAAGVISNFDSFEAVVTPSFFEKTFFKDEASSEEPYKKQTINIDDWNYVKENYNENEFQDWITNLEKEFIVEVDNESFILLGSGLSPDFMYPVVNQSRPIPDQDSEELIYLSEVGYSKMENNFRGSPFENFIVGINKTSKNYLSEINDISKDFMSWPLGMDAAYSNDDLNNNLSAASQRVIFIPEMVNVINLISAFLTSFIIILTLIVIAIMIKRFIEINKTDLAILLANGYSKWELVFSLTLMILLFSGIAIIAGVITGISLQPAGLLLFSSFWTLPTITIEITTTFLFSVLGIAGFVFGLIAVIFSFVSLRGDVVNLMKKDSNHVQNKLSKVARKAFKKSNILTLFRVSLAFSTPWKILSLSIMSSIAMSSLSFSISNLNKFIDSENKTFASKNFANAIELYSPTNAGGLYYSTPIDRTSTTLLEGLYSFDESITMDRYNELVWNEKNTDSLLIQNEDLKIINTIDQGYFNYSVDSIFNNYTNKTVVTNSLVDHNMIIGGNLHLPSINDSILSIYDPTYVEYKTSSKLSLEHQILFTVPWNIAEKLMPSNTAQYFNDNYDILLENIFRSKEVLIPGNDGQPEITFEEAIKPFVTYTTNLGDDVDGRSIFKLTYFDETNQEIKQFKLDGNKLLEDNDDNSSLLYAFGFVDNSIKVSLTPTIKEEFINIIYGVEQIENLYPFNYNMNYKKIPISDGDETFTTTEFKIVKKNNENFNISSVLKARGIKENSKFISLLNSNSNVASKIHSNVEGFEQELLNEKTWEEKNFESFEIPVIANQFAKKSFDLKVNDILEINVLNDIMRFEDEFNLLEEKKYYFKIVDFNDSFKDNEFYISQENANILTGISLLEKPINDFNIDFQEILKEENNISWLDGFNGFFTSNEEIPQALSTISLYSPYNLYFGTDRITNPEMLNIMKKNSNGGDPKTKEESNFYQAIIRTKTESIFNSYMESEAIIPNDDDIRNFQSIIQDMYNNDSTFVSLLATVEPTSILQNIFKNTANLTQNLQIISVSIIVVSIFIIIILITLITISDSMKLAGILKALGLRSRTNALSFLLLYFPVVVIGLMIAVPLSFLFNILFAEVIFVFLDILISWSIPWYVFGLSSSSIITLFIISFLMTWRKIKKQKLYQVIK